MFVINWEKLKTFLIVLFAVLNVFLIAFISFQNAKFSNISDDTVDGTVNILKSKNINVDSDKILRKQVNLNVIELKNAVVSHSFPSEFKRVDEKTFSIEKEGSIKTENDIKKVLKQIGIKDNTKIITDGTKATVYLQIKDYKVFDVSLELIQEGGKVKISGSWYFPETKPKKSSDMSDIVSLTGVLIDFSNIASSENFINIDKIELGYYISESSRNIEKLNVTAAPCYKISTSDGKNYYFNARNGEFLK